MTDEQIKPHLHMLSRLAAVTSNDTPGLSDGDLALSSPPPSMAPARRSYEPDLGVDLR